ncbi:hypothetical protein B0H11DRAFT_1913410 [Mycena galericulata]|nr:hypothetical protein B0H11DRAFT_1913410 [Mycena galericulata]
MPGTTLTRSRALRRASPPAPPRAPAATTITITPLSSSFSSSPAPASYPASASAAHPAPRRNPHHMSPRAEAPQSPAERDALIFRIAADAFDACFHRGLDSRTEPERRPVCPLMESSEPIAIGGGRRDGVFHNKSSSATKEKKRCTRIAVL